MKKRVVIGMSGGVDSSVAAYLLKEQGYDVIGIMMKLTKDDFEIVNTEGGCCSLSAANDARKIADLLDIPFYVLNFKEPFKINVIDYFIDEYIKGRTPNPCVMCNRTIKFSRLLDKARMLGADYIATGHYAEIVKKNDRYVLKVGKDKRKDQTYMLYSLNQDILEHTLMPCGQYTKEEIREIAKEIGMHVSSKRDSQEICFIPNKDHGDFIAKNSSKKIRTGNFIDKQGNILGRHKGIVYYTIGQRKGLGIAVGKPLYVIDILQQENQVVLGDECDLFKSELIAKDLNFLPFDSLKEKMEVKAKIRYSAKPVHAEIEPLSDGTLHVIFAEKQRAITKGQSVVFYDGDYLLGGGIIDKVL